MLALVGSPLVCALALVLLIACVPRPPEAELRAYADAFQQAEGATDAVVETFAPIERRNGAAQNRKRGEARIDRDTAVYYATIGLPPLCASVSRGFDVLARYNEILVLYAEGRSFEEIRPSVDRFVASVDGLAAIAGATAGGPVGAAAAGTVATMFEPAKQLLATARAVSDRRRLGEFIRETDDLVLRLLETERQAAANLLSQAAVDVRRTEPDPGRQSERLAELRRAVANWMVLLEQVEGAFRDLAAAVERGSPSGADLAALAAWSEELRVGADNVRGAAIAAGIIL